MLILGKRTSPFNVAMPHQRQKFAALLQSGEKEECAASANDVSVTVGVTIKSGESELNAASQIANAIELRIAHMK